MMEPVLWAAAHQAEMGQVARRLQLVGEARRLARTERRRSRRPRDWSAPLHRGRPQAPASTTYWPHLV